MIAIKERAGANHVRPGFGTRGNGGAVGNVYDSGLHAEFAEAVDSATETLHLLLGLMADRRVRENFRRSQMGERAGEFEVLALRELIGEAIHV